MIIWSSNPKNMNKGGLTAKKEIFHIFSWFFSKKKKDKVEPYLNFIVVTTHDNLL